MQNDGRARNERGEEEEIGKWGSSVCKRANRRGDVMGGDLR